MNDPLILERLFSYIGKSDIKTARFLLKNHQSNISDGTFLSNSFRKTTPIDISESLTCSKSAMKKLQQSVKSV